MTAGYCRVGSFFKKKRIEGMHSFRLIAKTQFLVLYGLQFPSKIVTLNNMCESYFYCIVFVSVYHNNDFILFHLKITHIDIQGSTQTVARGQLKSLRTSK